MKGFLFLHFHKPGAFNANSLLYLQSRYLWNSCCKFKRSLTKWQMQKDLCNFRMNLSSLWKIIETQNLQKIFWTVTQRSFIKMLEYYPILWYFKKHITHLSLISRFSLNRSTLYVVPISNIYLSIYQICYSNISPRRRHRRACQSLWHRIFDCWRSSRAWPWRRWANLVHLVCNIAATLLRSIIRNWWWYWRIWQLIIWYF